jgi:S1-C subfamily serine protease
MYNGRLKMPEPNKDALTEMSASIVARTQAVRPLVAEIRSGETTVRSGTLWRAGVVIASEQALPKSEKFEVVLAGSLVKAYLAGRDQGTNIAVLKFEQSVTADLPPVAQAEVGALALAFGADGNGGLSVRLGAVNLAGPAWHSRAGGKIDARVYLDLQLSNTEEGGPVVDAAGGLLGISTLGPRGRVLVIPAATVERVVDPLLAHGRIARGWLGLALQPVVVPESLSCAAHQESGLMVMSSVADGPAATAGVVAGDILLQIAGVPVTRMHRLAEQLGPDSVGRMLDLKLIRAGAITSVSATITARPEDG